MHTSVYRIVCSGLSNGERLRDTCAAECRWIGRRQLPSAAAMPLIAGCMLTAQLTLAASGVVSGGGRAALFAGVGLTGVGTGLFWTGDILC